MFKGLKSNNDSVTDEKTEKKYISEIKYIKDEIKKLKEQNDKLAQKNENYESELKRQNKIIDTNDETIRKIKTDFETELSRLKEIHRSQINSLNEEHNKNLVQSKKLCEIEIQKNQDKLSAIIEANKQFDELVAIIYAKYEFLNDERKYNANFDLGEIIESAYFFNSATKNYVLRLPDLFKQVTPVKFKSQGVFNKSDKANIDYLLNNNVAVDVYVADADSVKRNQDLSRFITDLREKLIEANVKDISSVIIENHRIKL